MSGGYEGAVELGALFDLGGKLALVTGCRRGIGLVIADVLAQAGADVIGVSSRLEPGGSEVRRRVEAAGRSFTALQVDLVDPDAVRALASDVTAGDRPIDVLVNNAGIVERAPASEHDDRAWERALQVNLTAPFVLTREIGRTMVRRGAGKVIFTASVLSFQGGVFVPGYTASKSGVAGLVKAFSNEWAPHGVNVNGLAPGYIETEATEPLWSDADRSRSLLERIPIGRWGRAEDLAGAALFLASPASDYMCGSILVVDGGWLAR